jgi:hypothetical protein
METAVEEKLRSLLNYVSAEGRVCPMPRPWADLWNIVCRAAHKARAREPIPPRVLGSWWNTPKGQKMLAVREQLVCAAECGVLDEADRLLRTLRPDDWAYGDGTTTWDEHRRLVVEREPGNQANGKGT